MVRPLEGLTVVAIEQAVAAPFCTVRLADAGARVIKIERPAGDFARGYDDAAHGESSYFVWLNRGKQSVVLDLEQESARRDLEALVAGADIFVQNLKPGALGRLGFAVERLRRDYPGLITCSISGYGDTGPLADRKAYDLLIQAGSGLASLTGGPEGPARVGISVVDIATGATAHAAILEALIARQATGRGADIRISMFDVMSDWLTVPLLLFEAGRPPIRMGLAHASIAPYGVFTSQDGKDILIAVQSEREWQAFCAHVLLEPDLPHDARFESNVARVKNRRDTDGLIASIFSRITLDEIVRRLTKADTAFSEVNDMAGLAGHPHLRRISVGSQGGPVSYPAPAPFFVDSDEREFGRVPALGQDTDAVLGSIGREKAAS